MASKFKIPLFNSRLVQTKFSIFYTYRPPNMTLSWDVTKPISSIKIYDDETGKFSTVSRSELSKKISVRKNDVVGYWYRGNLIEWLTEPVQGDTLRDLLKAYSRLVNRALRSGSLDMASWVYTRIGDFIHKKDRIRLARLYESNKLKLADLMGDHVCYEGYNVVKCGKRRVWVISLGS